MSTTTIADVVVGAAFLDEYFFLKVLYYLEILLPKNPGSELCARIARVKGASWRGEGVGEFQIVDACSSSNEGLVVEVEEEEEEGG